jgi:hypothetical protein
MKIIVDAKLSKWLLIPSGLTIFALPSVAVTVKSGVTPIFTRSVSSLILGRESWNSL